MILLIGVHTVISRPSSLILGPISIPLGQDAVQSRHPVHASSPRFDTSSAAVLRACCWFP